MKVGFVFLLSIVFACNFQEKPIAETKYLTSLEGTSDDAEFFRRNVGVFLISKIFERTWKFAYVVDKKCTQYPYTINSNSDLYKVIEAVKDGMRMWLRPVKDHIEKKGYTTPRKVVDTFVGEDHSSYYNINTKKKIAEQNDAAKQRTGVDVGPIGHDIVFTIFFYCELKGNNLPPQPSGWSFIKSGLGQVDHKLCANSGTPEIHIFLPKRYRTFGRNGGGDGSAQPEESNIGEEENPTLVGDSGVSRGILLHELGHLFGLKDTYYKKGYHHSEQADKEAEERHPGKWKGTKRKHEKNINLKKEPEPLKDIHRPGKYQRRSIMQGYGDRVVLETDENGRPVLLADDKEGVVALYEHAKILGAHDGLTPAKVYKD